MISYDVAIIGGGPAGMAAAIGAKEAGADRVVILETDVRLGGILNQCIHNGFGLHIFGEELTGPEYAARFERMVKEAGIDVKLHTLVTAVTPSLSISAVSQSEGLLEIQAGAIVMASGCRERPRGAIRIAGTRPAGVLTAGTAQKFVNIEGILPGKECVILGSGDIGLIMARRMTFEGVKVRAVVELMPYSSGLARNIKQCLDDFDIPLLLSHTVVEIHGKDRVTGVTIAKVDENRLPIPGTEEFLSCDTLLLSVGLVPSIDLAVNIGAKACPATSSVQVNQDFETSIPGLFACGNTLHVHDLVDYVTEESKTAGRRAAAYACGKLGSASSAIPFVPSRPITYTVPQAVQPALICEDVTLRFRTNEVVDHARVIVRAGKEVVASFPKRMMAPGEMQTITIPLKKLQPYFDQADTFSIETEVREA